MLEVSNLSFDYPGDNKALVNINFKIDSGSKVFFHGANGAGKTTLFQCLNGLFKVKTGVIKLNDKDMKKPKELMREIGIVFQNANDQIIAGNVFDEVSFGPINMGLPPKEVISRVEDAMETMNITHLRDRPPHFLSYGQKKRVTIASVLSMNQDYLILDEPTAGLDVKQTEELIDIINALAKSGKTLLISTHDTDFSYRIADRVIVLEKGEIIGDGTPEGVFSDDSVLSKTGIIKPIIMEVYECLRNKEIVPTNMIPKSRKELIDLITSTGGNYEG